MKRRKNALGEYTNLCFIGSGIMLGAYGVGLLSWLFGEWAAVLVPMGLMSGIGATIWLVAIFAWALSNDKPKEE